MRKRKKGGKKEEGEKQHLDRNKNRKEDERARYKTSTGEDPWNLLAESKKKYELALGIHSLWTKREE